MAKERFGVKLDRRIEEIADEQAHEVGIALRKKARELTPKDTGNLRKRIYMSARKREKSVYVYVDYSQTRNEKTGFNYGKWIFEGQDEIKAKRRPMVFTYRGEKAVALRVRKSIDYNIMQRAIEEVRAERNSKKGRK